MKKAIAIASLGIAFGLHAQTSTPSTGGVIKSSIVLIPMCTVKGTIGFAVQSQLPLKFDMSKGDKCSNVEVRARYDAGGGQWKDAAAPVKATGILTTGYVVNQHCTYLFPMTVATGKPLMISAEYKAPAGSQVAGAQTASGGTSGFFSVQAGQTYTKDFLIVFTFVL